MIGGSGKGTAIETIDRDHPVKMLRCPMNQGGFCQRVVTRIAFFVCYFNRHVSRTECVFKSSNGLNEDLQYLTFLVGLRTLLLIVATAAVFLIILSPLRSILRQMSFLYHDLD